MSTEIIGRVWKHAEHSGNNLLVLLAMADFADSDGHCWPAIPTLAKMARVTERSAINIIGRLERDGAIYVMRQRGRSRCNHYVVLVGMDKGAQAAAIQAMLDTVAEFAAGVKREKRSRKHESPTTKGENSSAKNVKPVSPDPLIEPSEKEPSKEEKAAATAAGGSETDPSSITDENRAAIFTLYDENVHRITPAVAEHLDEFLGRYGLAEVRTAIEVAVMRNVRTLDFVEGVLRRRAGEPSKAEIRKAAQYANELDTPATGRTFRAPFGGTHELSTWWKAVCDDIQRTRKDVLFRFSDSGLYRCEPGKPAQIVMPDQGARIWATHPNADKLIRQTLGMICGFPVDSIEILEEPPPPPQDTPQQRAAQLNRYGGGGGSGLERRGYKVWI